MARQPIGRWLTSKVAQDHGLTAEHAEAIVVAVLAAVVEDLRGAVAHLEPTSDLGLAARTFAVRIEHAHRRCAVGMRWPRKRPAGSHIAKPGP